MTDTPSFSSLRTFEAYNYWNARKNGNTLPARADLDPADLEHLFPCLAFLDVKLLDEQKSDFLFAFRLIGSELTSLFSPLGKAQHFSKRDLKKLSPDLDSLLHQAIADQKACLWSVEAGRDRNNRGEVVILPLSADGKTVNMLLLCGETALASGSSFNA